jgi:hypothetical protein
MFCLSTTTMFTRTHLSFTFICTLPVLLFYDKQLIYFFYLHLFFITRASPIRYTTGYLQMYSWSNFDQFNLEILISLLTFGLFLKRVEDTSEEVCDAYGVCVILQNQTWGRVWSTAGRSFENKVHSNIRWWAVCIAFSGQLQFGGGVLFIAYLIASDSLDLYTNQESHKFCAPWMYVAPAPTRNSP